MRRLVLITGCSGGGKSTLIEELGRRGHAVVPEPGRRIVREEQGRASPMSSRALPWINLGAFAMRALTMARQDMDEARAGVGAPNGHVFFDRGLVDAAVAIEQAGGGPADETLRTTPRYDRLVFVAPPWPEIFANDPERRHGLEAAVEEFRRLRAALARLGYAAIELPRTSVADRARFVLERLDTPG